VLQEIQKNYLNAALKFRESYTRDDIQTLEELRAFFTPKNEERPEIHGGLCLGQMGVEDPATEQIIADQKITIRCLPLKQRNTKVLAF